METILKVKFEDQSTMYVVGVHNKSIDVLPTITRIFSSNECSAIYAGRSMVKHVYESNGINVEILDANVHEAFAESMRRNPAFRVPNENSETSQLTGLKPWHHCFAYGKSVFGVIWDTREIDVIVTDLSKINFADCVILKTDSGEKFRINEERYHIDTIYELRNKIQSTISDEQFMKILWP